MNSINRIAYSNRKIDKTMHLFWSKNMTNWAQYDNHWLSRPGWNVINVILSMVWWSNRVISLYLYIDENWIKNYHFQKNSQRIEDLASYSSFFFWFHEWIFQMIHILKLSNVCVMLSCITTILVPDFNQDSKFR